MIKRLLLSLAAMIAVMTAGAQNRQLILSHEGTPSFFALNEMDKALEAAVANDTIFVPDCNISGFKLTKPITILGTGRNTIVTGSIHIGLQDPKGKVKNALLDGLRVTDAVLFLDCTTPGTYHVRFCSMYALLAGKSSTETETSCNTKLTEVGYNMPNLIVESCYMSESINLGPGVKSAYICNSKVRYTRGSAPIGAVNYEFCNIAVLGKSSKYYKGYGALQATFSKTMFGDSYAEDFNETTTTLINCSIYINANVSPLIKRINCIRDTKSINADSLNPNSGYATIDGEQIGAIGGTSPYSEYPSLPTITQSTVEMDAENRLVKISLKIDGGAPAEPETPTNPENPVTPETPETPTE